LRFARPVGPCPEHTSGRLENHEPPVGAPHLMRVHTHGVSQAGPVVASLPVVDPEVGGRPLIHEQGQAAAVRRQTWPQVIRRLDTEGFSFARAIQPLNGPQPFRPATPVSECSASRDVDLGNPECRVARYLVQRSGGASHLQPVRIKRHGEQRCLRHIDQMTAPQIPRVHACMLDQSFPPAILQRHDRDRGPVVVSILSARGEQHGRAARQDLRPPMGNLSKAQFGNGDRLSSLGWNLRQTGR
jgi:hypothetical protein